MIVHDLKIAEMWIPKNRRLLDDMEKPVNLPSLDLHLGVVGIGSFDDKGYFDDIILHGVEIKKVESEGSTPKMIAWSHTSAGHLARLTGGRVPLHTDEVTGSNPM